MLLQENYSGFLYFNALTCDFVGNSTAGRTIDLRGYKTVTVVLTAYSLVSGNSMSTANYWNVVLQHGLASADGVSTWSLVPGSQIIHSVYGGYDSTSSTGKWLSLYSITAMTSDLAFAVGYKMDTTHRYLRIYFSGASADGADSIGINAAAIAILGRPGDWPVNEPV